MKKRKRRKEKKKGGGLTIRIFQTAPGRKKGEGRKRGTTQGDVVTSFQKKKELIRPREGRKEGGRERIRNKRDVTL